MNEQDNCPFESSKRDLIGLQTVDIDAMTMQVVEEIKEFDPEFVREYGTTIEQGKGYSYSKKIKSRYEILYNQLLSLDLDKNGWIEQKEIHRFFQSYRGSHHITELSIERLWNWLNKDISEGISIPDFIFGFIKIEERLKWKIAKWNKVRRELVLNWEQFETRAKETQNEPLNSEGICRNASWSINWMEANDLKSAIVGTEPSVFVQFCWSGKKQKSSLFPNNANPEFLEDFTFPVSKRGEVLEVEVYDQTQVMGSQWIGKTSCPWSRFESQLKSKEWYGLSWGDESPDGQGRILLRIRYIYDWHKYFNTVVSKTKEQIIRWDQDLSELNRYNNLFMEPFGIIVAGEIDKIIENNIFEKSDDVLDYIANGRQSIYIQDKKPGSSPEKTLYLKNNNDSFYNSSSQWNNKEKITAYVCFGLTLISFWNRYDPVGLLMLLSVIAVIVRNVKSDLVFLPNIWYLCASSLGVDLVWFINEGFNYKHANLYSNVIVLRIVFLIVLLAFIGKCVITWFLFSLFKRVGKVAQDNV